MLKRLNSTRIILIAFIVFLISSGMAGIFSTQFDTIQSSLALPSQPTKVFVHRAPTPTISPPSPTVAPLMPPKPAFTLTLTQDTFDRQNQVFWGIMSTEKSGKGTQKIVEPFR